LVLLLCQICTSCLNMTSRIYSLLILAGQATPARRPSLNRLPCIDVTRLAGLRLATTPCKLARLHPVKPLFFQRVGLLWACPFGWECSLLRAMFWAKKFLWLQAGEKTRRMFLGRWGDNQWGALGSSRAGAESVVADAVASLGPCPEVSTPLARAMARAAARVALPLLPAGAPVWKPQPPLVLIWSSYIQYWVSSREAKKDSDA